MKKYNKLKIKGFSLVELLLAMAIFGLVVSANFGLAIDAYRSRQNDRLRLEAGLVIKDSINSLYTIKNSSWSEMIAYFDQDPDGSDSRKVEIINNKVQINFGQKVENGITYNVYFKKADRDAGELQTDSDGSDPDTIKVVVEASWTDIFNNNQQLTETYFLTNWLSTTWTEYNYATFTGSDGGPTPVMTNTEVSQDTDNVLISSISPIANSDWCNIVENTTTKSYDLFPTGSGNANTLATNVSSSDLLEYEIYEPEVLVLPTNAPAAVAPVMSQINNSNTSICDGTGTTVTQCESLLRLYTSTNGDNWTNKSGWRVSSTPCDDWYGVTCDGSDNVIAVELQSNNLTGSIPIEIGNLTSLVTLDISQNALTGSIPPQIGLLTDLELLDLSNNQISGVIPKTIGNNINLSKIDLSENDLEGQIPSSVGLLSSLDELYLQNNTLTCHIPANIANLTEIDIDSVNPKLDLSGNNLLLPTSISFLNTFLDERYVVENQNEILDHEDCLYRPVPDKVFVVDNFVATTPAITPKVFIENLQTGSFPPELIEQAEDLTNWDNTSSDGLSFDGGDIARADYSPHWNVQDEMTIMAWIRSLDNSQDNFARIIDFSNGSTGWYLSFDNPNKLHFRHYGTENLILQNGPVLTHEKWTHVAIVISAGTGTIYLDGVSSLTDTYNELTPVTATDTNLDFGASNFTGPSTVSNGSVIDMDEVRIYNRALSQNEILKTYQTEVNRNDAGLVGYWRMNVVNSSDQTFYDYSFQGKHAWRGGDLTLQESDPTLTTGNARYIINDIYKNNNQLYMSTTNPSKDVVVYDLTTMASNFINFSLGTNDDTQGVVIVNDTRGYALQDSFIIQFDPSAVGNEYISSKNLSTISGLTLRNLIDFKLNDNQLYLLGLDSDGNFGVMDVTNGITPTPKVSNLLMEAFL